MAMVGLFWIGEDSVYVGAEPAGAACGVRLSEDGVETLGAGRGRFWTWDEVVRIEPHDVPVRSGVRRLASMAFDAALVVVTGDGELPPAFCVEVTTADETVRADVLAAVAVGSTCPPSTSSPSPSSSGSPTATPRSATSSPGAVTTRPRARRRARNARRCCGSGPRRRACLPQESPSPLPLAAQAARIRVDQLGRHADEDQPGRDEQPLCQGDAGAQDGHAEGQGPPGSGTPVLPGPGRAAGSHGPGEPGVLPLESCFEVDERSVFGLGHGFSFPEPDSASRQGTAEAMASPGVSGRVTGAEGDGPPARGAAGLTKLRLLPPPTASAMGPTPHPSRSPHRTNAVP